MVVEAIKGSESVLSNSGVVWTGRCGGAGGESGCGKSRNAVRSDPHSRFPYVLRRIVIMTSSRPFVARISGHSRLPSFSLI